MGNLLFLMLHIAALIFSVWGLLLTIPLHLIYAAVSRPSQEPVESVAQVHCPDCRELVRFDARKCKHCGAALTPAQMPPTKPPEGEHGIATAIAALIILGLIAYMIS